jgi:hypothetical protein
VNRAQMRLRVKQWIAHTCIAGAVRGIDRDVASVATDAMIRALSGKVAPPVPPCPREGCGRWSNVFGACKAISCKRMSHADDMCIPVTRSTPKRRGRK